MNGKIGSRVERLEQQVGGVPDLAGEARQYGAHLWSAEGFRAYAQDGGEGARVAVVGPLDAAVYKVLGVALEDLR
ncbi:hypothetical protein [Streptomyces sp. 1222.5]|uniref:hypothetical protein n=1 Tax=Streptomyces sp. 1222.5 TaxID=1881026 RepID=UPI003D724A39